MKINLTKFLGFFIFFIIIQFLFVISVNAATKIESLTLTSDTVWTSEDSPYEVTNVTLNAGVKLTLEEGVIINGGSFNIKGTLRINGTEENPVTFNNGRIVVFTGAELISNNTVFSNAGMQSYYNSVLTINNGGNAQVNNAIFKDLYYWTGIENNGNLTIANSNFNAGGSQSIYGIKSTNNATITNCNINMPRYGLCLSGIVSVDGCKVLGNSNYGYSIDCQGGTITIKNSEITTNKGIGLRGNGNLTVQNNLFNGNNYPVSFSNYSQVTLTDWQGNTFSNNTNDGYQIESLGSNSMTIKPLDKAFYLYTTLTIPSGKEVSIEPGTVFYNGGFNVNGILRINGTEQSPVVINNSSITISTGAELISNNTVFSNAGMQSYYNSVLTINNGGNAQVRNSTFKNLLYWTGIENSGNLTIENSSFGGSGVQSIYGIKSINNATITNCNINMPRYGLSLSGTAIVDGCKVICNSNYGYSIDCQGGIITIRNSEISTNRKVGLTGYGNLTIQNNLFNGNEYPVSFRNYSEVTLTDWQGNTFSNNTNDGYQIESLGSNSMTIKPLDKAFYLYTTLTIPSGKEVSIEPGTVFYNGGFNVNGILRINGTEQSPVVINNSSITISTGAELISNNTVFSNAGMQSYNNSVLTINNGGNAQVRNSTFKNLLYWTGIENSGNLTIENSSFGGSGVQ